ncbi:MAG: 2-C-methyl-D-erythritol 4-phosphate cytidylyltransferase [Acidimicrobiia bacterium]|nr:2-C-methyl-D-erythritol 4-phosphate cytidylyltransferase [Acidimicrobiia bacterium]
MKVWAIVVAAGRGERFGAPKQFLELAGRRVVDRAVDAVAAADGIVVALPDEVSWDGPEVAATVVGGATRSESVRAGLEACPADAGILVVHDAARALAPPRLFDRVVAAVVAGADGAVPGVVLSDTVKRVAGGVVTETLDRADLVASQTPQAFRAPVLRAAHAPEPGATDDAALVEAAGGTIMVVQGDPVNMKLTTESDLAVAGALLRLR